MTTAKTLRVGTRRSRLALAQTAIAVSALPAGIARPQIVSVVTEGDRISAQQPGGGWVAGDGQFTRELQGALLDGRVDLVVHSFKDLPTEPVPGLLIAAVLERGDARDCLLGRRGGGLDAIPRGGRVGTSSPRRAAQLASTRPDLVPVPLRGNVQSRLRRLRSGEFDGLLLAAAGLDRLGVGIPPAARLSFEIMLPAPAQGALALEVRADDLALRATLAGIDHRGTRIAVDAERGLLRQIGGGCLAPLGALGEVTGETLRLRGAFETPSGTLTRAEATGSAWMTLDVVQAVARHLSAPVQA